MGNINDYKKYEPIFGNWQLQKLLGEGSYGAVFEIIREEFGVKYDAALKIISIPKSESDVDAVMDDGLDEAGAKKYFEDIMREMMNEFALMAKLKGQSNIVSYEDHQIIPHQSGIGWDILMRMELLTPLRQYQKEHMRSEQEVVKLGIDICRALELCQQHKIIHRDIKPENIFVSQAGDFKLGDFGIAKSVEKTTGASTRVGTSTYMAPEVTRGEKYDATVDIYSLGIVMYRFLNDNRLPFYPPYPEQITFKSKEEAQLKRQRGDEVPDPVHGSKVLADIVRKAIAFNPRDRYQSAEEMKMALDEHLRNDVLQASDIRTSGGDDGFQNTKTGVTNTGMTGTGLTPQPIPSVAPASVPTASATPIASATYTSEDDEKTMSAVAFAPRNTEVTDNSSPSPTPVVQEEPKKVMVATPVYPGASPIQLQTSQTQPKPAVMPGAPIAETMDDEDSESTISMWKARTDNINNVRKPAPAPAEPANVMVEEEDRTMSIFSRKTSGTVNLGNNANQNKNPQITPSNQVASNMNAQGGQAVNNTSAQSNQAMSSANAQSNQATTNTGTFVFKFCPFCGNKCIPGYKFCNICGKRMADIFNK